MNVTAACVQNTQTVAESSKSSTSVCSAFTVDGIDVDIMEPFLIDFPFFIWFFVSGMHSSFDR